MHHVFTKDFTGAWRMLLGFGYQQDAEAAVRDFAEEFLQDYRHLPRQGQDYLIVKDVDLPCVNADMHELLEAAQAVA